MVFVFLGSLRATLIPAIAVPVSVIGSFAVLAMVLAIGILVDARRFWDARSDRLREFSLSLHPDKTRLIEFGRFAAQNTARALSPSSSP